MEFLRPQLLAATVDQVRCLEFDRRVRESRRSCVDYLNLAFEAIVVSGALMLPDDSNYVPPDVSGAP